MLKACVSYKSNFNYIYGKSSGFVALISIIWMLHDQGKGKENISKVWGNLKLLTYSWLLIIIGSTFSFFTICMCLDTTVFSIIFLGTLGSVWLRHNLVSHGGLFLLLHSTLSLYFAFYTFIVFWNITAFRCGNWTK